jgi:hypothetical protein
MRPAAGKSLSAMRDLQTPVAGFRSPFGALSQTGTAAFTEFSVRPYFVMDTPKNKYLTSKPERSDNLSELMTSVALGNATVIDKGGALKWRLHNLLTTTVTADWGSGSNASVSGDVVTFSTTNSSISQTVAAYPASAITAKIDVASSNHQWIRFITKGASTWFDLTNGVVGVTNHETAEIEPLASGGYELLMTDTTTAGANEFTITAAAADGSTSETDGAVVTISRPRLYRSDLGGMQLNSKDGTDYLPTDGAAGYALRRDYSRDTVNGEILGEPAGVNLLTYFQDFSNAAWVKTNFGTSGSVPTVTVNAVSAPDGTMTADAVLFDAVDAAGVSALSQTVTGFSGIGTFSVWLRAASGTEVVRIRQDYDGSSISLNVTVTDQWRRFAVTTPAGQTGIDVSSIRLRPSLGTATTATVYVWGAQLEAYHVATSVIPTYGASEARAKDEASCIIADKIPGFIQGSGTIVFEGSIDYLASGGVVPRLLQIDDGTNNNRVSVYGSEAGEAIGIAVVAGGVATAVMTSSIAAGTVVKGAFRYAEDDFGLSLDGATATTDTTGAAPVGSTVVRLGTQGGVDRPIRISHLSIGPYASPVATPGWSNAQLAVISGS